MAWVGNVHFYYLGQAFVVPVCDFKKGHIYPVNADNEPAHVSEWSGNWLRLWLTSLAALFREQATRLYDQPSGHTYVHITMS